MRRKIRPASGPINATIRPPGSKSITNRALVCAAMAQGTSLLRGALDSDDTRMMMDSLARIGINVEIVERSANDLTLKVNGCGGKVPQPSAELFVGNSGTTIRFLTAALGVAGGNYTLDGIERMRERPIGDLVDAMNTAGIDVDAKSDGGCPPVEIKAQQFESGCFEVRGNVSSQYLSGLLMAAPLAGGDVEIKVVGALVSRPYIQMTIAVMKSFGVVVEVEGPAVDFDDRLEACPTNENVKADRLDACPTKEQGENDRAEIFRVRADQQYRAIDYEIEPDASAASYFFAAAAICGGEASVEGLNRNSLQGDVQFVECLKAAGCKVAFHDSSITVTGPATQSVNVNMSEISDTAQTLAAVALFLSGTTTITGISHNRVKETDRIGNLAIELRKLGATVKEMDDGMAIEPGDFRAAIIDTYDDHRMAMSLSLAGLRIKGVEIDGADCVSKTYPRFFEDLETVVGVGE